MSATAPPNKEYTKSRSCQIANLPELLKEHIGFKTNGTFIEIGAFDGESWSNTSTLADLGWRGTYVEPIPEYATVCTRRHTPNPPISVLQVAVGADRRKITLSKGRQITTGDPDFLELYNRADWARGYHTGDTVEVQQITLEDVFRLSKITTPRECDILVIDVEGMEWEVLRNFPITKYLPKMVIIELEDNHPSIALLPEEQQERVRNRFRQIRSYFNDAKYRLVHSDNVNSVYVH